MNKDLLIRKLTTLLSKMNDLYWEEDRMSTSGVETLDECVKYLRTIITDM